MTRGYLALLVLVLACCACGKRGDPPPLPRESSVARSLSAYVLDTVPPISHPVELSFDNAVSLLGYDIEPAGALPRGREIKLTLYWALSEQLSGRWKLLTHVLDPFGGVVADLYNAGPLRVGKRGHPRFPPSDWRAGRVYVDQLAFKLPKDLAARKLRVVAGVYSTSSLSMIVTRGTPDDQQRGLVATLDVAVDNPGITVEKLQPEERIDIDGRLSESAWQATSTLGPFLDVVYGEPARAKPPVQAQARLLWGNDGLYLGCEVVDQDIEADAGGSRAPELWQKDAVVLVVDDEADGGEDYELQIGPQNLVVATRGASGGALSGEGTPRRAKVWHARAKTAVVVDGTLESRGDRDRGYVVEAMIPWRSFDRSPRLPQHGNTWKLNLYAMNHGTSAGWAPSFAKDEFRRAPRFGTVVFAPHSL